MLKKDESSSPPGGTGGDVIADNNLLSLLDFFLHTNKHIRVQLLTFDVFDILKWWFDMVQPNLCTHIVLQTFHPILCFFSPASIL